MNVAPMTKLSNGQSMPMVGLGTYSRKADKGQFKQAVLWGIETGYRHLDTAAIYANEEEIGDAITQKISEGFLSREQLFVTTKLWNDSHLENDVVPALQESLKKLKLKYVDLYLIHWPFSCNGKGEDTKVDYLETWKGMEKAVELGLTRSIGVSNFNEVQLKRLIDNCRIKPTVNQFEINPTLTQHKLVSWCKDNNVVPVAYTPLGLVSEARPEFAHLDAIKTDPELEKVADKYGKSRAQITLRYLIQRGIAVIPKSFTKSRIEENLNIFDFELNKAEMELVDKFNIDHHCVPATPFRRFVNYPF